jgi:hypothetical protein
MTKKWKILELEREICFVIKILIRLFLGLREDFQATEEACGLKENIQHF